MIGGMNSRKIRLRKETLILYDWLCLNSGFNGALLNCESFTKWFQDEIGDSLSAEQLSEAISELSSYHLIDIIGWQIQPQQIDRQQFYMD